MQLPCAATGVSIMTTTAVAQDNCPTRGGFQVLKERRREIKMGKSI